MACGVGFFHKFFLGLGIWYIKNGDWNCRNTNYTWLSHYLNYFTSSYPHHDIYTFCYWQIFWHSIWQIFWHFIWHIFWHMFWHIFWHSIWHIFWHIFWHSIWLLRSSGAHWARKAPGWGPAVRTELGRSQVEVQRCALGWEGPRLRSSSAHWAPKLAKSLAKSWQGSSVRGSGGRGGKKRRRTRRRRRKQEEEEDEEEEDEENSSDKI